MAFGNGNLLSILRSIASILTPAGIWRLIVLVIGLSVLLAGVLMTFLPGPATLVIPLGLAILATQFAWARRILQRIKYEVAAIMGGNRDRAEPEKKAENE